MPSLPYPRQALFDHGFRVWLSSGTMEPYGREVEVHDRGGRLLYQRMVPLPDGGTMRIRDAAVSPSGLLAAVGPWNDSNDSGSMTRGLVILDQEGSPMLSVDTFPFLPEAVCFGPDGDVWLFGVDAPSSAPYDLLRKYNRKGVLVRTALPRDTLPETVGAHLNGRDFLGYFNSSGGLLGLYLGSMSTWFDLAPDGEVLSRTELPPTPGGGVAKLALTASGDLYAGNGRHLFRLNRSHRQWQPAKTQPEFRGGPLVLEGTDGPDLVLADDQRYPPRLLWFSAAVQEAP